MESISEILGNTVGKSAASSTRLAADFDTFLILLTAQLQAQDPLDPLASSEFTSQLVQFTAVEQQILANKNLENLAALLAFNGMTAAVNYLGKEITIPKNDAEISAANPNATWLYEFDSNAFNTDLEIVDSRGAVVVKLPGQVDRGLHSLNWDGRNADGQLVPAGNYKLRVKATDSQGLVVKAEIFMRGKVEGVEMEAGEAQLTVGNFKIPITQVLAVALPKDQQPAP